MRSDVNQHYLSTDGLTNSFKTVVLKFSSRYSTTEFSSPPCCLHFFCRNVSISLQQISLGSQHAGLKTFYIMATSHRLVNCYQHEKIMENLSSYDFYSWLKWKSHLIYVGFCESNVSRFFLISMETPSETKNTITVFDRANCHLRNTIFQYSHHH